MKKIIRFMLITGLLCFGSACNRKKEKVQFFKPVEIMDESEWRRLFPDEPFESGDEQLKEVERAEPIRLSDKQTKQVASGNRFAFKMFKQVSARQGTNTVFSPLSLNLAMGMLYNGATGETRTEMAEATGMAGFTDREINTYSRRIWQSLSTIDPLTEINIANSIWYGMDFQVKDTFVNVNREYFDALVAPVDPGKPGAADIINQWCADKTNDRIKSIVPDPLSSDITLCLLNALYFKSTWRSPFEPDDTETADFTKAGNRKIKVNMMEQKGDFAYCQDENLQFVELPYGNNAFSMSVVLGRADWSINRLIEYLDESVWENINELKRNKKVWLKLPRFKTECAMELETPLRQAGINRIFSGGLTGISDEGLAVSAVKQKTFVEVNEKGTEAAAVTIIEMMVGSAPGSAPPPPEPVRFFADRPFLYLISERSTGVILFIGRMDEPKE